MQVKKLKKVRISLLFFAVLVSAKCSFAQSFFKENNEIHSNFLLFSDSLQTTDTIVFVNTHRKLFQELGLDTDKYYTWSIYETGASITQKIKLNGKWQGNNRYYPFQVKQEEIFGKDVLIFLYEEKLYFFEILEDRPAVHNSGSLIILVKC